MRPTVIGVFMAARRGAEGAHVQPASVVHHALKDVAVRVRLLGRAVEKKMSSDLTWAWDPCVTMNQNNPLLVQSAY